MDLIYNVSLNLFICLLLVAFVFGDFFLEGRGGGGGGEIWWLDLGFTTRKSASFKSEWQR